MAAVSSVSGRVPCSRSRPVFIVTRWSRPTDPGWTIQIPRPLPVQGPATTLLQTHKPAPAIRHSPAAGSLRILRLDAAGRRGSVPELSRPDPTKAQPGDAVNYYFAFAQVFWKGFEAGPPPAEAAARVERFARAGRLAGNRQGFSLPDARVARWVRRFADAGGA